MRFRSLVTTHSRLQRREVGHSRFFFEVSGLHGLRIESTVRPLRGCESKLFNTSTVITNKGTPKGLSRRRPYNRVRRFPTGERTSLVGRNRWPKTARGGSRYGSSGQSTGIRRYRASALDGHTPSFAAGWSKAPSINGLVQDRRLISSQVGEYIRTYSPPSRRSRRRWWFESTPCYLRAKGVRVPSSPLKLWHRAESLTVRITVSTVVTVVPPVTK